MYIRVRQLPGLSSTKAEPSSQDLSAILVATGCNVASEDIHVRSARIAHDQYDRTFERFPVSYLMRFAETLPGKSLLPGHDTVALPIGRWFDARTQSVQEPFPVLVNPSRNKDASARAATDAGRGGLSPEIVPGFESRQTKVHWLAGSFYFAKDPGTELMRKNIDTGVYQDDSIGFKFDDLDCDVCGAGHSYFGKCPHIAGQPAESSKGNPDEGTQIVTLTYSGNAELAEARETSLVYLGAQQGAELEKALRDGSFDPYSYAAISCGGSRDADPVRQKLAEYLARRYGCKQKVWAFPNLASIKADGEGGTDPKADTTPEDPPPCPHCGATDGMDADGNCAACHKPMKASSDSAEDTGRKAEGENMDLKKLKKLLGLPEDTPDAEVILKAEATVEGAKAVQDAVKASTMADVAKLAQAGQKALSGLEKRILDDDLRLRGSESVELKEVVEHHVSGRNFDRLTEISTEKAAAVLEKFPIEAKGDASLKGEEDTKDGTRTDTKDKDAKPLTGPFHDRAYAIV